MYVQIEIFFVVSSKNCNALKTLCKNKIHVQSVIFALYQIIITVEILLRKKISVYISELRCGFIF